MNVISIIIVCIISIITLNANEKLPYLFIEQLMPIQKSKTALNLFDMNTTLQNEYNLFNQKYDETISIGLQAERSKDVEEIKYYLSALRQLQTMHDRIIDSTKSIIYSRLENGECKRVSDLNNLDTNVVFSSQNMQNQVINLYQSQCQKVKIDWVEDMIQNKKKSKFNTSNNQSITSLKTKNYKNDIPILLFITSNPVANQDYNKKIIALLVKYRFQYIVYDVFTSKYALELLKQYSPPNVMYYPTIAIGQRTIHGYNPAAIFDALKEEWFADRPLEILKID